MRPLYRPGLHPVSVATIVVIMGAYGIFFSVATARGDAITLVGVLKLWPLHLILILNLIALFARPAKS